MFCDLNSPWEMLIVVQNPLLDKIIKPFLKLTVRMQTQTEQVVSVYLYDILGKHALGRIATKVVK